MDNDDRQRPSGQSSSSSSSSSSFSLSAASQLRSRIALSAFGCSRRCNDMQTCIWLSGTGWFHSCERVPNRDHERPSPSWPRNPMQCHDALASGLCRGPWRWNPPKSEIVSLSRPNRSIGTVLRILMVTSEPYSVEVSHWEIRKSKRTFLLLSNT